MNFEMSDERRMLSDTLSRYLGDACPPEHRAKVAYDAPYHDAGVWRGMAELGVLMALVPEEAGGFGGAGFDVTALFEVLGGALCPEPVLPALMAARLLMTAGEDLDPLLTGATHYALAMGEEETPFDPSGISCGAVRDGEGWRLSGRKSVVYGGQVAERFLVAARHDDGIGLFEVGASAAQVAGYGLIDGGGAAELMLDQSDARLLLHDAVEALEEALDFGRLALCAEAVGALDRVFAITSDYLRTRQQFGRPIGSFQALQHRMVDLKIEIEQARSITILAASRMGEAGQGRAVAMAKHLVGRTAQMVAEEAIQLHGGIAMTWEYPVSHYAKRLVMIDAQLGDADDHLERVMAGYAES